MISRLRRAIRLRKCNSEPFASQRIQQKFPTSMSHSVYSSREPPLLQYLRFGLLGALISPFAAWIAIYSFAYVDRHERCRRRLKEPEKKLQSKTCVGRDRESADLQAVLACEPRQILLVAGTNEAGKSRFLASNLAGRSAVSQIDTTGDLSSASDLVHAIARSLSCDWLELRRAALGLLPVAGSEILVLKERFSVQDLKDVLEVATAALEANAAEAADDDPVPVILIDGFGEWDQTWLKTREGDACMRALLKWALHITKERKVAHVICTADERFALLGPSLYREIRGNVRHLCLNEIDRGAARKFLHDSLPVLTDEEVECLLATFGGFMNHLTSVVNEVRTHPSTSIFDVISLESKTTAERVAAAFREDPSDVGNHEDTGEDSRDDGSVEEEGSELQPLKDSYSRVARDSHLATTTLSAYAQRRHWSALQLWHSLQLIVERDGAVPYAELLSSVFDGDSDALLGLVQNDILGFSLTTLADEYKQDVKERSSAAAAAVGSSSALMDGQTSSLWLVHAATPLLAGAFRELVRPGSAMSVRMEAMEHTVKMEEKRKHLLNRRRELLSDMEHTARIKKELTRTLALAAIDADLEERVRAHCSRVLERVLVREMAQIERDELLQQELSELRRESLHDAKYSKARQSHRDYTEESSESHSSAKNAYFVGASTEQRADGSLGSTPFSGGNETPSLPSTMSAAGTSRPPVPLLSVHSGFKNALWGLLLNRRSDTSSPKVRELHYVSDLDKFRAKNTQQLREIFLQLSVDGVLSVDEVLKELKNNVKLSGSALFSQEIVAEAFLEFDVDKNGKIDFDEFVAMLHAALVSCIDSSSQKYVVINDTLKTWGDYSRSPNSTEILDIHTNVGISK